MENISVFLSEWQVLFREGIHFTLSGEEDFEVIGEATDNAAAIRHTLDLILPKLAANDRSREVIKAAQSNLPPIISTTSIAEKTGEPITDYVTRDEFSSFKETLIKRLKSFIGELI